MFRFSFSIAAVIAAGGYLGATSSVGAITRGEVADRNAAYEVARCAKQYKDPGMWKECLDIVTQNTGRKPENVARHVNRQEGRTVFDLPE